MPDPDYPTVRKGQKVTYHGDKDQLMEIKRFNGVGNAWLTHKDDVDGFWAREGNGPGEWEPVPPRRKPRGPDRGPLDLNPAPRR